MIQVVRGDDQSMKRRISENSLNVVTGREQIPQNRNQTNSPRVCRAALHHITTQVGCLNLIRADSEKLKKHSNGDSMEKAV